MHFNGRAFGKIDPLNHTPFTQYWDGEGINPPPPETAIRITDDGSRRVTDSGDTRITD
jgi:hypothetical protein